MLALDGRLGRIDGLVLLTGIVVYTLFQIRQSRRERAGIRAEYEEAFGGDGRKRTSPLVNVVLVLIGLVLLVLGAHWLVAAAVAIATALGVSELVLALTIVAAGTSLPEVATSVLATLRGERDIAVGNVVGSSIFNLLAVLGLGSLVAPVGVPVSPGALTFDMPVMLAVVIAALPIFFSGYVIARWEGAVFLGYYVAYTTYLVLDATEHAATATVGAAMLWFVLPLTALTLAVVAVRAFRRGRRQA
jgi:cation:H+ antiporter